MKAVYERPNVHFEMFEANTDVAAICVANQRFGFECLRGQDKDTATVLNVHVTGGVTCDETAGIVWYNQNVAEQYVTAGSGDKDGQNNLIYGDVTSDTALIYGNDNGSTSLGSLRNGSKSSDTITLSHNSTYDYVQATPNYETDGYTFLGWLYITGYTSGGGKPNNQNATQTWTYDTDGWSIDTSGRLVFSSLLTGSVHAMLSAIWGNNVRAS